MQQALVLLAQDTPAKPPPNPLTDGFLLPMLLMAAAFFFIIFLPSRRREKKEREDLLGKLKKNDEVLTSAGLIGIVAQVKDDEVVLKVDESSNVRMRFRKAAIVQILNAKEAAKDASAKAGQDASPTDNVKAGSPPAAK